MTDGARAARQGARPQGRRRLRRRLAWTRRSTRCRRASTSSSARPAASSTCIERGELSVVEPSRCSCVDEADRMADMGFMPQVQKILYRIDRDAPDDALLGDARRRGQAPGRPLPARPGRARGRVETSRPSTRWTTVFFARAPDGQGEGRGGDRAAASTARSSSCAPSAAPTASSSSSSARACKAGAIHGDLRQGAREQALADFTNGKVQVLVATDVAARGIHVDSVDVVDPLRPARGRQGLPPPFRAHRTGRRERRRGHADALEPGERRSA